MIVRPSGVIVRPSSVALPVAWPTGVVPVTHVRDDEQSPPRAGTDLVERTARDVVRGSAGLPLGVQVVARHWREDVALAVMAAIEAQITA